MRSRPRSSSVARGRPRAGGGFERVLAIESDRASTRDGDGPPTPTGGGSTLERDGELLLGMVALDQAFAAARWVAAGSGFATAEHGHGTGFDPGSFEAAREQVRAVRNLIIHMDERIASNLPAILEIDGPVIRASQSADAPPVAVGTAQWSAWLDALDGWLAVISGHA